MRIFIDCTHTATYTYKNTGIHRVVRKLASEILKISDTDNNIEVVLVSFDGIFIKKVNSLEQESYNLKSRKNRLSILCKKITRKLKALFFTLGIASHIGALPYVLFLHLRAKKFAGVEFSANDIYLIADANWDLPGSYYKFLNKLKDQGVTIAVICYDLIPIKFPEFCSKSFANDFTKFYSQYSCLFEQVLCISKVIAEDYLKIREQGIFSEPTEHQSVVHFKLGSDYINSKVYSKSQKYNTAITSLINKRFILVVGSLVPHKNIKTIVIAFDLILETTENLDLVFISNRGWHAETDHLIESNSMYKKRIHILESVNDEELRVLYESCYCLVQASFYEGFGLPVVEALQHGKVVVSSTGGSLPEVGGDFCLYFDPNKPVELYQALKKLIDSDTYYNQMITRIKSEYTVFSWRESAEQILSYLYSQKN